MQPNMMAGVYLGHGGGELKEREKGKRESGRRGQAGRQASKIDEARTWSSRRSSCQEG